MLPGDEDVKVSHVEQDVPLFTSIFKQFKEGGHSANTGLQGALCLTYIITNTKIFFHRHVLQSNKKG